MLANVYQNTWRNTQEDGYLHSYRHENLKSDVRLIRPLPQCNYYYNFHVLLLQNHNMHYSTANVFNTEWHIKRAKPVYSLNYEG
jgi:hypothetical protein